MKRMFLAFSVAVLISSPVFAASARGSWEGWVSDAKCGATKIDANCVKECEKNGSALVFVNDKDKSVMQVTNQGVVKGHEGHHIKVKGSVDGDQLTISSVSMLKDQSMK